MRQILTEEDLRGFAEAVDAEAALMPEVNGIGIIFENLLLGKLLLQMQRNQRLRDFAAPTALLTQIKQRARQLLR